MPLKSSRHLTKALMIVSEGMVNIGCIQRQIELHANKLKASVERAHRNLNKNSIKYKVIERHQWIYIEREKERRQQHFVYCDAK